MSPAPDWHTQSQFRVLYKRLPTACSLCQASLEECALLLPPRREYTLYVGVGLYPFAAMLLKRIGAVSQNNPFAPYINLIALVDLEPKEWFLQGAVGEAFGSEGL